MSVEGLRSLGIEATRPGMLVGRSSTGAGAFEEVPTASLLRNDGTLGCLLNAFPRTLVSTSTLAALTSGTLRLDALWLPAGCLVTSIAYFAGTTALTNGTAQWFALFDGLRTQLAVTGDDTTTAWAANAMKKLALATAYRTTRAGLYYTGICVVGDTPPTLAGVASVATGPRNIAPLVGGASDTSLTDPASCPAIATTITADGRTPYVELF